MTGKTPTLEPEGTGIKPRLRQVRWQVRRVAASLRYGKALQSAPVLFGNSFPKSGTHLLAQALSAFPHIGTAVDRGMGPVLTFVRFTGRQRSAAEILADLRQLQPGDLCFGHVIADPEILRQWKQEDVAHFFMLRDPRDVVISHALYIGDKAVHNVHHEYYSSLPDDAARIKTSILGRPGWENDFPDIRQRYQAYLGWLECPDVCLLRYEDFILDRPRALEGLLNYAISRGFKLAVDHQQALEAIALAIDPRRSFTFRKGQVGDWRNHFNDEHKRLFKDLAGDLLVQLGYENDLDW